MGQCFHGAETSWTPFRGDFTTLIDKAKFYRLILRTEAVALDGNRSIHLAIDS